MLKRIGLITVISTLLLALLALPALASFTDDIARDLGAKTATLVAPAGNEWLIDLDAASGVQIGDLFVVAAKGTPVIHPVTKKVIGSIDEPRALLRVSKIKSGYSYATVVNAAGELKAGEEARRFAGMPALFWDYAGDGEGIFAQLQGALPELNWQSYGLAQAQRPEQPRPVAGMAPSLVFVLNAQGLGVKDHQLQPLRFYRTELSGRGPAPPVAAGSSAAGAVAAVPVAVPAPSGASIVAPASQAAAVPGSSSPGLLSGISSVFGGGSTPPPGPGSGQSTRGGLIVSQMDSKEGVWYGPRMEGQPVGIDVADLDGDGRQEVALGFKDRVVVARVVAGKFEPLADYAIGQSGDILTLDAFDLNGDGRAELFLSVVQPNSVRSQVLVLRNGQLEAVVVQVPYFLR